MGRRILYGISLIGWFIIGVRYYSGTLEKFAQNFIFYILLLSVILKCLIEILENGNKNDN